MRMDLVEYCERKLASEKRLKEFKRLKILSDRAVISQEESDRLQLIAECVGDQFCMTCGNHFKGCKLDL